MAENVARRSNEPWLQRLRDGETPSAWPLAVTVTVTTILGVLIIVGELTHPHVLHLLAESRRAGFLILGVVPVAMVLSGPVTAVSTTASRLRDRRAVRNIRAVSEPSFFLPVSTSSLRRADDLPRPRPIVWTTDGAGLHGWTSRRDVPVVEVPWGRVRRIDLATRWDRGRRQDYGIWIGTDDGHLVLRPRTALGRPFEAGATKRDVLLRELRTLRHDADAGAPSSR